MGIKTGFFYLLFWACEDPTVANVDPNSSAACIVALRSQGLLSSYPSLHGWLETIQETKHGLLKINIGALNVPYIKTISIICHCIFLDPAT